MEAIMELVFTTVAVIGGLAFSLAVAIVVEELIFGKVLCVLFAQRTQQPKIAVQRYSVEPLRSGAGQTS
jgi:nitrate/nitrite transporter NarK